MNNLTTDLNMLQAIYMLMKLFLDHVGTVVFV